MTDPNDKNLKDFISKNTSKRFDRPPGEWNQILNKIEESSSKKSWFFKFPPWLLALGAATAAAVLLFTVVNPTKNVDDELGAFLLDSQGYFSENNAEEEDEHYDLLINEIVGV